MNRLYIYIWFFILLTILYVKYAGIMHSSFFSRLSTFEIQSILGSVCILRRHVVCAWYCITTLSS
jgi:hypothetical protein